MKDGATAEQHYVIPPITGNTTFDFFSFENESLEYGDCTRDGYPRELNYYRNFHFLTDYKTVRALSKYEITVQDFKNIISVEYGKEISDNIFEELVKINRDNNEKEVIESAKNLQKLFLKCVEQKIDKLKTKDEVLDFTKDYRWYKDFCLARYYIDEKDKTDKCFNIKSLDEKMVNKILLTNAIKLSDDTEINKNALTALLSDEGQIVGEDLTVQPDISKIEYLIDSNGNLVLMYEAINPYSFLTEEHVVRFVIEGNEPKIKKVTEENIDKTKFKKILEEEKER